MKKADKYILITIFILIVISSIGIYGYKFFFSSPSATAVITVDGKVTHTIDLDKVDTPYEFKIETQNGGYNVVSVEPGRIKISDSNCPDKLCIQTGLLSKAHDITVCLPHKLFIEISSGEESEIDSLSH